MAVVDVNFNKACNEVVAYGREYLDTRRDAYRLQVPSITFKHSMADGFPAITNKNLAFNSIKGELIWFLRGDNDITYLNENKIRIWNKDAFNWYVKKYSNNDPVTEESKKFYFQNKDLSYRLFTFEEFSKIGKGSVGQNYSVQWRNFNGKTDQIKYLIEGMRDNIMSTWLKVAAWNPTEIYETALPPCHDGFQVIGVPLTTEEMVSLAIEAGINVSRKIKRAELIKLHVPENGFELHWNQRSTDKFLGFPFNVASYGLLSEILSEITGYPALGVEGTLKCVHFYDNQYNSVTTLLSRDTNKHGNCKLIISREFKDLCQSYRDGNISLDELFNLTNIDMFELEGYSSDDALPVDMLAPKNL